MITAGEIMVRTQIQLTEQQARELKSMAAARGITMAELIRKSVDLYIQTAAEPTHQEMVQKLKELAGKYTTGITDWAENHDDYLDEIYGESVG
jgi:16S rRNA U516 pseudouridylate synthase RsuA-like enzyme